MVAPDSPQSELARPVVLTEAIPPELKQQGRWVNWRHEVRDGKSTKVPYNPRTDAKAKSDNPATWSSFEVALAALSDTRRGFAGLGFVFTESGCTGVDLDKVLDPETGDVEPWALDIIGRLASYTEVTPSGAAFTSSSKAHCRPASGARAGSRCTTGAATSR